MNSSEGLRLCFLTLLVFVASSMVLTGTALRVGLFFITQILEQFISFCDDNMTRGSFIRQLIALNCNLTSSFNDFLTNKTNSKNKLFEKMKKLFAKILICGGKRGLIEKYPFAIFLIPL